MLPWAFEGLVFTADDHFPTSLVLAGRRLHVDHREPPPLGRFRTVKLVENVSPLASPRHARKVVCIIGPPSFEAVARARQELFAA